MKLNVKDKNMVSALRIIYFFCIVALACFGCKKAVIVGASKTVLTKDVVFNNDGSANAAVLGIYSQMMSGNSYGNGSITIMTGLSADELVNYLFVSSQAEFYANNLNTTNTNISQIWAGLYFTIYQANAVIEGLSASTGVSENLKKQLSGEAKFMRSFCYFYLVNLWDSVPLVLSTNYKATNKIRRDDKESVYQQIVMDLTDAVSLLPFDYSMNNSERTRPTRFAALALLARVYLYQNEWEQAELAASEVINYSLFHLEDSLDAVFLKNSNEAVWQLAPVEPGVNTREGNVFVLADYPDQVALSDFLLNSFENQDKRKIQWTGSLTVNSIDFHFPYKYKEKFINNNIVTEYYTVLRLAEQFLIRAESRTQLDKLTDAKDDLNVIRNRAGLANTSVNDKPSLLIAIEKEKRVEFFAEWGHRWLELKRLHHADLVLSAVKGSGWQPADVLYPIPQIEIQNDPNLSQNPGYN